MKNIRIDQDGNLRCWKCGASGDALLYKRTARSKVLFGVGALATKKKIKCQVCGEYNDTGNAEPWAGTPAEQLQARKAERDAKAQESARRAAQRKAEEDGPGSMKWEDFLAHHGIPKGVKATTHAVKIGVNMKPFGETRVSPVQQRQFLDGWKP